MTISSLKPNLEILRIRLIRCIRNSHKKASLVISKRITMSINQEMIKRVFLCKYHKMKIALNKT